MLGLALKRDLPRPHLYLEALVYLKEARPSIVVVSILPVSISAFRAFSSSTSQFAHSVLPFKKRASGLLAQRMKWAGRSTEKSCQRLVLVHLVIHQKNDLTII